MKFYTHPLRDGVTLILEKHFAPEIVKKFKLVFEAETFQGQFILNQLKNDKVAMEVYYDNGESTEYICDVWSWMNPKQAEAHLLRMITDKAKEGKIGKNWVDLPDGRISEEVTSGKHETPDTEVTKKMTKEVIS